jgi:hypothetical protein
MDSISSSLEKREVGKVILIVVGIVGLYEVL